ncbi:MAG: CRISPR-associated protein Cas4 [Oscillospiraceae bacterium]|nr:CRISPR-associated protein Cas4 [Oscillospiraceae bacterium]
MDTTLQLSGLQHFLFCRRQWALIHIEKQWHENYYTISGQQLHERAHNEALTELRGNLLITRGLSIFSHTLRITGKCDVVEFRLSENGVPLFGREGRWQPFPVEYKRGEPKANNCDAAQLCAQAICLEEMFCCEIPQGALFYGQDKRRAAVTFTPELRLEVGSALSEMHELIKRGHTPRVKPSKSCNACSLKDKCLPGIAAKYPSVADYLSESLGVEP